MNYKLSVVTILYELGIRKRYRSIDHLVSCLQYIDGHVDDFIPITKILYVDVAKIHKTSNKNVERGIRALIERIWDNPANEETIEKIFGKRYVQNRPANTEFIIVLYNYINLCLGKEPVDMYAKPPFSCPLCDEKCPYYEDMLKYRMRDVML